MTLERYTSDVKQVLLWNYGEELNMREQRQRMMEAWQAKRPVHETAACIAQHGADRYLTNGGKR
jgi:hypothetical protein